MAAEAPYCPALSYGDDTEGDQELGGQDGKGAHCASMNVSSPGGTVADQPASEASIHVEAAALAAAAERQHTARPVAASHIAAPQGSTPGQPQRQDADGNQYSNIDNDLATKATPEAVLEATRRKAAYSAMMTLLEEGAAGADKLAQLAAPLSGLELLQVAEERTLAGKCGSPLCFESVLSRDVASRRRRWEQAANRVMARADVPSPLYCSDNCRCLVEGYAKLLGDPLQRMKPESRARLLVSHTRRRGPGGEEVAAQVDGVTTMLANVVEHSPADVEGRASGAALSRPAPPVLSNAIEGFVPRGVKPGPARPSQAAAQDKARLVVDVSAATNSSRPPVPVNRLVTLPAPSTPATRAAPRQVVASGGPSPARTLAAPGELPLPMDALTGTVPAFGPISGPGGVLEPGDDMDAWSRWAQGGSAEAWEAMVARWGIPGTDYDSDIDTESGSSRSSSRGSNCVGDWFSSYSLDTEEVARIQAAAARAQALLATTGQAIRPSIRKPRSDAAAGGASGSSSSRDKKSVTWADEVGAAGLAQAQGSGDLPPAPIATFTVSRAEEEGGSGAGADLAGTLAMMGAGDDSTGSTEGQPESSVTPQWPAPVPESLRVWFPPEAGGLAAPQRPARCRVSVTTPVPVGDGAASSAMARPLVPPYRPPRAQSLIESTMAKQGTVEANGAEKGGRAVPPGLLAAARWAQQMTARRQRGAAVLLSSPPGAGAGPRSAPHSPAPQPPPGPGSDPSKPPSTLAPFTPSATGGRSDPPPGVRLLRSDPAHAAPMKPWRAAGNGCVPMHKGNGADSDEEDGGGDGDGGFAPGPVPSAPSRRLMRGPRGQPGALSPDSPDGGDAHSDGSGSGDGGNNPSDSDAEDGSEDGKGGGNSQASPGRLGVHDGAQESEESEDAGWVDDDGSDEECSFLVGGEASTSSGSRPSGVPFFSAPPPGYRVELSPFNLLWSLMGYWVTGRTKAYLNAAPPARVPLSSDPTRAARHRGGESAASHAVLSSAPTPDAAGLQAWTTFEALFGPHLEYVMTRLGVGKLGLTGEVEKRAQALVSTLAFPGPVPSLRAGQWRLFALAVLSALSFARVPDLARVFDNVPACAGVDLATIVGETGFELPHLSALVDRLLNE